MSVESQAEASRHAENPLWNLLFNIVVPVFVLHKGTKWVGPAPALALALFFPLSFGTLDLWRKKKVNFFSLLGLLNVSVTGGLALSGLGGIWFCFKEAAFPLFIGFFVAGSAWTDRPFIQTLIVNPQTMHWDMVDAKLKETGKEAEFMRLLQRATWLLSGSFLFSAITNFILARGIFLPLDDNLGQVEKAAVLNDQIAHMTSMAFAVTFLPSLVILAGILYYLLRGMSQATGMKLEEILKS
ncbi:MAG: hypothetical protein C5B49_01695 [Bdellovibrio sp.]|nr:MAG: hypothetical protein C5B49_01695 [Bdellovibrio sp.]